MHSASIAPLPTRAEFIRDQLAEYLDGLGVPTFYGPVDELGAVLHCDSVGCEVDVRIYASTGEMVDMGTGKLLTLKRFTWQAEAKDMGMVYGPASLAERTERLRMGYRLEGPTTTPASATCSRCGDPVQGGTTMHPTCKTLG